MGDGLGYTVAGGLLGLLALATESQTPMAVGVRSIFSTSLVTDICL